MKMNLVERQQWAIDEILSLRENGRRAMGYKLTLLNKAGRGLARIRDQFKRDAAKMGYNARTIEQQWQDVKDMAVLEARSE